MKLSDYGAPTAPDPDLVPDTLLKAVVSDDGLYRYRLSRRWGGYPLAYFVMLNPSTADAEQDDPTIRKCVGFAKRWHLGGIEVVNLFAYRATNPKDMLRAADPVGPDNGRFLYSAAYRARAAHAPVVAAWGANAPADRAEAVVEALVAVLDGEPLLCLGQNRDGTPKHPLMLAYETPLTPLV